MARPTGGGPSRRNLSPLIPALFSAPRQRPCSRDATRRADSRGRHNNGSTVDHRSRDGAPNARRTESKASGACLRSRYGLHGEHCRSSAWRKHQAVRLRSSPLVLSHRKPPPAVFVERERLDRGLLGGAFVQRLHNAEKLGAVPQDRDTPISELGGGEQIALSRRSLRRPNSAWHRPEHH
jgi:hypothetical protein